MRIGVIGTGYVGLVAATCLADKGHQVVSMDVDPLKVLQLAQGRVPYYEPHLEELLQEQLAARRIHFTADLRQAVADAQVVFITVGTPSHPDGSVDLRAVFEVADGIGRALSGYQVIVIKSTVPVGTADQAREMVARQARGAFSVVSNPEFLREGQAVHDFLNPDRVILGGSDSQAIALVRQIYEAFTTPDRILVMDHRSAEMAKYAANAFLATRVSFINEVAALCEGLGADVEQVRRAIGMDPRIGHAYLSPGLGYGGSCLPKDMRAILSMARQQGVDIELLPAVQRVNGHQPARLFRKIADHFEGTVKGRRITFWGLAFKAGTDDMRESPAVPLVRALASAGAHVTAYDPRANGTARALLGELVAFSEDQYLSLSETDALVIATDWNEFRRADLQRMRHLMRAPILFDGRNILDPDTVRDMGFVYYGTGGHGPSQAPAPVRAELHR